ncbi:DAPIT [Echinococcus multilocularis]|uniref:DAPIT n=1 Tax=Echinococcus multilocularis TaxID=6211 RepID=A0A068YD25_ECHMU|nr:DAPIT [Echinococcus multilocularis]
MHVYVPSLSVFSVGNMSAGGENPNMFTGWRYYFNTYTIKGRSNIVYTTYAATALLVLALNRRVKRNRTLREAAEGTK